VNAGLAADGEDGRAVLERDGGSLRRRLADEDEAAGADVVLLAAEREARAAGDDDVHLLVPERLLAVLLDDVLAPVARVAVDPEGADAERPSDRPQCTPATSIDSSSSIRRIS
jgi:hypothetical protein